MAHTVVANGLTVSHKGTGGFEVNSTPDVCKLGNGVPVPFAIISFSRDLVRGTTTVFADGGNSIGCAGSAHARCTGDEPGVGLGVISGTQLNESTWITTSPDVRVEGRHIARLSDKMFMNNRNCTSGVGGHYEPPAALMRSNPVMAELCRIFCEARDEWHRDKSKGRPSDIAKRKLDAKLKVPDSALNKAIGRKYPGSFGAAERTFFRSNSKVLEGARKAYDRSGMERAIKRQVEKLVRNKVVEKGAKMAARWWLKVVPGLNILSTLYDVADLAMTANEIYNEIQKSGQIMDEAVKIKPDFAVMGEDGSLKQVYDFKFDDPSTGYKDGWQKGQFQAYRADGDAIAVDNDTCKCDRTPRMPGPRVG